MPGTKPEISDLGLVWYSLLDYWELRALFAACYLTFATYQELEATGGFEPPYRAFAEPRLNHLATSPRTQEISLRGPAGVTRRPRRVRWSGRRDSNSRPSPWQGDALPLSHSRAPSVPALPGPHIWCRGGDLNSYELTLTTPSRWRVYQIPPPRHGRSGRTRTPDRWFWRPLLYQLSYAPIRAPKVPPANNARASLPAGATAPRALL